MPKMEMRTTAIDNADWAAMSRWDQVLLAVGRWWCTVCVCYFLLRIFFLVWGYDDSGFGKRRGWDAEQGTDIMDVEDGMDG